MAHMTFFTEMLLNLHRIPLFRENHTQERPIFFCPTPRYRHTPVTFIFGCPQKSFFTHDNSFVVVVADNVVVVVVVVAVVVVVVV